MRMQFYGAALSCFTAMQVASAQEAGMVTDFSRGQLFNLEIRREAALEQGGEFALPLPFSFPDDARPESIFGADVSHHNFDRCKCKADWTKAASNRVVFVYAKATQGTAYVDRTFKENWSSLSDTSIRRGAYHFLSSDGDPQAQAQHFVDIVRAAGGLRKSDMPPSLDIEWDVRVSGGKVVLDSDGRPLDYWSNVSADEIVKRMEIWLSFVERELGRAPVIYTSRAWWLGRLKDEKLVDKFEKNEIWLADYSASGRGTESPREFKSHPYTLWQFSDSGAVRGGTNAGVDLGIDVSIFRGASADFDKKFGTK